jgi:NIPSNAP
MYLSRPAALAAVVVLLMSGLVVGAWFGERVNAAQNPRVFELRTYTAPEGKLGELHARFRDHTLKIFERHGMTNVVYLKPLDTPLSDNTLVYLLAHPSRGAAKANWAAFAADPEWKKVASESQVNGRILTKVESVFLEAADYSPMK